MSVSLLSTEEGVSCSNFSLKSVLSGSYANAIIGSVLAFVSAVTLALAGRSGISTFTSGDILDAGIIDIKPEKRLSSIQIAMTRSCGLTNGSISGQITVDGKKLSMNFGDLNIISDYVYHRTAMQNWKSDIRSVTVGGETQMLGYFTKSETTVSSLLVVDAVSRILFAGQIGSLLFFYWKKSINIDKGLCGVMIAAALSSNILSYKIESFAFWDIISRIFIPVSITVFGLELVARSGNRKLLAALKAKSVIAGCVLFGVDLVSVLCGFFEYVNILVMVVLFVSVLLVHLTLRQMNKLGASLQYMFVVYLVFVSLCAFFSILRLIFNTFESVVFVEAIERIVILFCAFLEVRLDLSNYSNAYLRSFSTPVLGGEIEADTDGPSDNVVDLLFPEESPPLENNDNSIFSNLIIEPEDGDDEPDLILAEFT